MFLRQRILSVAPGARADRAAYPQDLTRQVAEGPHRPNCLHVQDQTAADIERAAQIGRVETGGGFLPQAAHPGEQGLAGRTTAHGGRRHGQPFRPRPQAEARCGSGLD